MAAKQLATSRATGATVYTMVIRVSDGYFLNDADGSFAAAPADPYLSLTEHGTAKGYYTVSESRLTWTDGLYLALFYAQAAGAPNPVADTLFDRQDLAVFADQLLSSFDIAVNGRLLVVLNNGQTARLKDIEKTLAGIPSQFEQTRSDINDVSRNIARG